MSKNKKFFWLKLKEDFFESDEIKTLDRAIMVAEALTIMPNSNYWIAFANEQNIELIGSGYVLRQDQCNEKTLLELLRQIWDDVFNS